MTLRKEACGIEGWKTTCIRIIIARISRSDINIVVRVSSQFREISCNGIYIWIPLSCHRIYDNAVFLIEQVCYFQSHLYIGSGYADRA